MQTPTMTATTLKKRAKNAGGTCEERSKGLRKNHGFQDRLTGRCGGRNNTTNTITHQEVSSRTPSSVNGNKDYKAQDRSHEECRL